MCEMICGTGAKTTPCHTSKIDIYYHWKQVAVSIIGKVVLTAIYEAIYVLVALEYSHMCLFKELDVIDSPTAFLPRYGSNSLYSNDELHRSDCSPAVSLEL
jgi:hypothetical protein